MTHYILGTDKFIATAPTDDWEEGQGYSTFDEAKDAARALALENPKDRYTIVEAIAEVYTPATSPRIKSL